MITPADIEAAAERIAGRVLRTPAIRSEAVSRATGPHAGRPVDRHHAVRALARAAQQAATAVVLEATAECALAGGIQRRADGVALVGLHLLAVEGEGDLLGAVDALPGLGVQTTHGSSTSFTSLVTVSRSAMNQARQPER